MADAETARETTCDLAFVVKSDSSARRALVERLRGFDIEARPFADPADFLEALPHLEPGCVILDLNPGGKGGLVTLREMQEMGYFWPAIIVGADGDIPTAVKAIRLGAVEFLTKPYTESELVGALAECHQALAERVERSNLAQKAQLAIERLSVREVEVFEHLAQGMTNKEIAIALGLSPRTIESHRALIMAKLGIRSALDLLKISNARR